MQAQRHRPFGITVLAIISGIAFIVSAFITLLFLGLIPAALFGGTGFFGSALLGATLWGLVTVIWAWVTVGLWNLDPQAWLFVVALSMLNIILGFISVLGASTWQVMLPSIIVNAIILIYALLPGVKDAFGELPTQL